MVQVKLLPLPSRISTANASNPSSLTPGRNASTLRKGMSFLTKVIRPPPLAFPTGFRSRRDEVNPGSLGSGSVGRSFVSWTIITPRLGLALTNSFKSPIAVPIPSAFQWHVRRLFLTPTPGPSEAALAPGWLQASWSRLLSQGPHCHLLVDAHRLRPCLVSPEHFLWYQVSQAEHLSGSRRWRILLSHAGHLTRTPLPGLG